MDQQMLMKMLQMYQQQQQANPGAGGDVMRGMPAPGIQPPPVQAPPMMGAPGEMEAPVPATPMGAPPMAPGAGAGAPNPMMTAGMGMVNFGQGMKGYQDAATQEIGRLESSNAMYDEKRKQAMLAALQQRGGM